MPIRIVIFGHGSIGKRHLKIVRESIPSAEIMVVRHTFTNQVPEYADIVAVSTEQAVAFAPQMAIIANPAPFHLQAATAMLNIGCHVFIEKPISTESNGLQEFIDKATATGLVCQVGYNLRYLSSLVKFRDLIKEGTIGIIHSVRCEIGQALPSWRPQSDYRNGVSARNDLGGGVLLELSHEIDYLQWIFGEINWVSAWIGQVSLLDIDVEDVVHVTMEHGSSFQNKGVVSSLNMDFFRFDTTRCCTAIGSNASLRWNGISGSVQIFEHRTPTWTELFHEDGGVYNTYQEQWSHFLNCVRNNKKPIVGLTEGFSVLRVVDAIRTSALNSGLIQKIQKNKN
jgi:predicted dehydrogenase